MKSTKETKRSLTRLLTTKPEIVCLDRQSHLTLLALALELAYKGKTVAKVTLAANAA